MSGEKGGRQPIPRAQRSPCRSRAEVILQLPGLPASTAEAGVPVRSKSGMLHPGRLAKAERSLKRYGGVPVGGFGLSALFAVAVAEGGEEAEGCGEGRGGIR